MDQLVESVWYCYLPGFLDTNLSNNGASLIKSVQKNL